MKMGFVGEVESRWFAVEDIGPRHEEGCACKVFGNGIELGKRKVVCQSFLRGWDRLACLTLSNYAYAMTARSDGYEIDFILSSEYRCNPTREEISWVINMVNVEHDETRGDSVGRLTRAVVGETAGMRRDDRQLTFEASELVGVVAVEEFDLVADVLDKGFLQGKFEFRPENRRRGA